MGGRCRRLGTVLGRQQGRGGVGCPGRSFLRYPARPRHRSGLFLRDGQAGGRRYVDWRCQGTGSAFARHAGAVSGRAGAGRHRGGRTGIDGHLVGGVHRQGHAHLHIFCRASIHGGTVRIAGRRLAATFPCGRWGRSTPSGPGCSRAARCRGCHCACGAFSVGIRALVFRKPARARTQHPVGGQACCADGTGTAPRASGGAPPGQHGCGHAGPQQRAHHCSFARIVRL